MTDAEVILERFLRFTVLSALWYCRNRKLKKGILSVKLELALPHPRYRWNT